MALVERCGELLAQWSAFKDVILYGDNLLDYAAHEFHAPTSLDPPMCCFGPTSPGG